MTLPPSHGRSQPQESSLVLSEREDRVVALRWGRLLVHYLLRLIRLLVVLGSAVILTSIGGLGIYASPVTLPLLLLVAMNSSERRWRIAGAVVGGLTACEVAWAIAWQLWPHMATLAVGLTIGGLFTVGYLNSRKLVTDPV